MLGPLTDGQKISGRANDHRRAVTFGATAYYMCGFFEPSRMMKPAPKLNRKLTDKATRFEDRLLYPARTTAVCTENPIRVYRVVESAKLAQWLR